MPNQRWHEWRNMSDTACPSHGVVRLVVPQIAQGETQVPGGGIVDPSETNSDNEVLGNRIILHGMRPAYDFDADVEYANSVFRGVSIHMAINGDAPVEPGQLGLLTFDLPAWVVVDEVPGVYVTVFEDWTARTTPPSPLSDQPLKARTGVLRVLGYDSAARRAFVGMGITYTEDEEILE